MCNVLTKNTAQHEHTAHCYCISYQKPHSVIIFAISLLNIHTLWKLDRVTLIEQSLTVIQQSLYSNKTVKSQG